MTYYVISHYDEHQEFTSPEGAEKYCRENMCSGILVKALADFDVEKRLEFIIKQLGTE
jgi:hypothetical protein